MEVHLSPVEWGAASRPMVPGSPPGDGWLALSFPTGVLLAVYDALGHGREAAESAAAAGAVLTASPTLPLEQLVARCGETLRRTRGVALALARIETSSAVMSWAAVGNVQGVLCRAGPDAHPRQIALVPRAGIVGRHLPPPGIERVTLTPGDVVLFATDGIASNFADHVMTEGPAQRLAERLLERHFLGTDDGLVMAAAFRGTVP